MKCDDYGFRKPIPFEHAASTASSTKRWDIVRTASAANTLLSPEEGPSSEGPSPKDAPFSPKAAHGEEHREVLLGPMPLPAYASFHTSPSRRPPAPSLCASHAASFRGQAPSQSRASPARPRPLLRAATSPAVGGDALSVVVPIDREEMLPPPPSQMPPPLPTPWSLQTDSFGGTLQSGTSDTAASFRRSRRSSRIDSVHDI